MGGRSDAWRLAYLLTQSAIAVGLQAAPPRPEILSTLFVPLSLQAALFYGRRLGFAWIAAFIVALTPAVMGEFGWGLVGLVMAAVYGGACLLLGHYADLISRTDAARRENERSIDDLRAAHRDLHEYAAQIEVFTASQTQRRMARDLHDSAAQTIFGMNLVRAVDAIGYLMFGMVAVRELTGAGDAGRRLLAGLLLAAMLILHLGYGLLFRRWPASRIPYFVGQTILIQALGLLHPTGTFGVCSTSSSRSRRVRRCPSTPRWPGPPHPRQR